MSTIMQAFQPPLYWQQFEDLTESVFRIVFGDPKPSKVGRPGQSQDGVDVYGYERESRRLFAVQCKRMDETDVNNQPFPGGVITQKLITSEIAKVKNGNWPNLDTWILATTAKRDARIQSYVRDLNDRSRRSGSFWIQIWFWDDYVTHLNLHHDLQRTYYEAVLKIHSAADQDRIILELVGEAFSRPAFRMPLNQEAPMEFIDALKDTQQAMATGVLKDRISRRVIRQTIGGRRQVTDVTAANLLKVAEEKVQELRQDFDLKHKQGVIQDHGGILQIPVPVLQSLNDLRDQAIAAINDALNSVGLPLL